MARRAGPHKAEVARRVLAGEDGSVRDAGVLNASAAPEVHAADTDPLDETLAQEAERAGGSARRSARPPATQCPARPACQRTAAVRYRLGAPSSSQWVLLSR
jgi:hypothetical protein